MTTGITDLPYLLYETPILVPDHYRVLLTGEGIAFTATSGSTTQYISVTNYSGIAQHLLDSSIHFTQSQINIPATQISGFNESVDDRVSVLISGSTGIKVTYFDSSDRLEIAVSNLMHNLLSGLTSDDHTIYLHKSPSTSSRNTISLSSDITALTINQGIAGTSADILAINNGALVKKVWIDGSCYLNAANSPTLSNHVVNLSYLSGNYTSKSSFSNYTGQVGNLSNYVLTDGTRPFTSGIAGVDPTISSHLTTKSYVDNAIASISGTPQVINHSLSITSPTSSENRTIMYADSNFTVTKMVAVLRGTAPSVSYKVRHGTDRSASGVAIVTAGNTCTSTTSGNTVLSFDSPNISAGEFIWVTTSATSGTVNEFDITIVGS